MAADAQEFFQHGAKHGKGDEKSRPRAEVMIADVGRRPVFERQETGANGVEHRHDEASHGGDESGVFSKGGKQGD